MGPAAMHPAFYGNFDWHSCVHGHWLLGAVAADPAPTCPKPWRRMPAPA